MDSQQHHHHRCRGHGRSDDDDGHDDEVALATNVANRRAGRQRERENQEQSSDVLDNVADWRARRQRERENQEQTSHNNNETDSDAENNCDDEFRVAKQQAHAYSSILPPDNDGNQRDDDMRDDELGWSRRNHSEASASLPSSY